MEQLYGPFELTFDGVPALGWENYNLRKFQLPEALQLAYFPEAYLRFVRCNRRMLGALDGALREIVKTWPLEERAAYGLNQFVKCYCFGDGSGPNLHWYGAAWELSPQVSGDVLADVAKIFTRNGFTRSEKRVRGFEYW
jgi:hypothetical protein